MRHGANGHIYIHQSPKSCQVTNMLICLLNLFYYTLPVPLSVCSVHFSHPTPPQLSKPSQTHSPVSPPVFTHPTHVSLGPGWTKPLVRALRPSSQRGFAPLPSPFLLPPSWGQIKSRGAHGALHSPRRGAPLKP